MPSIFQITSEIQDLERIIDMEETIEGSHEDIANFLIPAKEEQLAKKIDAYVSVYRSIEARRAARKNEAKHLAAMAKVDENQMARLKNTIKYVSDVLGKKKLEGETRTITISTSERPAIEVLDERDIPMQFKEQVWTWKIDKKAIAEHTMETGEIVNGTEIRKVIKVMFR